MALSLFGDPFFGDPFFGGGLSDVFSSLPAGCSITTDVGDVGGGGGGGSRDTGGRRRARAIPIDLIEFPNYYEVKADIPGQSKDKINLNVDNNTLKISVDRTEPEEQKPEAVYYRGERPSGFLSRNITLPDGADVSKLQAEYKDGVLIITIPKKESAKKQEPKRINVS